MTQGSQHVEQHSDWPRQTETVPSAANPGAVITDWTISTIGSLLCLITNNLLLVIYYAYIFVYILNTDIHLGTF